MSNHPTTASGSPGSTAGSPARRAAGSTAGNPARRAEGSPARRAAGSTARRAAGAGAEIVPRSVGRVLDLLEIILSEGSCNLTTAAALSDLTPTTALRHLRALEARGYVDRDEGGSYSSGPTILRIAASLRDGGELDRLVAVAQPHLDALAAETGESTYLAVSDGDVATYIAAAESKRAIRHVGWVGQNVPLQGTAVGDALADPGRPAAQTGAVEPDITAISLALQAEGKLAVALSVIGPRHRLQAGNRQRVLLALRRTVDQLCRDLGPVTAARAS